MTCKRLRKKLKDFVRILPITKLVITVTLISYTPKPQPQTDLKSSIFCTLFFRWLPYFIFTVPDAFPVDLSPVSIFSTCFMPIFRKQIKSWSSSWSVRRYHLTFLFYHCCDLSESSGPRRETFRNLILSMQPGILYAISVFPKFFFFSEYETFRILTFFGFGTYSK